MRAGRQQCVPFWVLCTPVVLLLPPFLPPPARSSRRSRTRSLRSWCTSRTPSLPRSGKASKRVCGACRGGGNCGRREGSGQWGGWNPNPKQRMSGWTLAHSRSQGLLLRPWAARRCMGPRGWLLIHPFRLLAAKLTPNLCHGGPASSQPRGRGPPPHPHTLLSRATLNPTVKAASSSFAEHKLPKVREGAVGAIWSPFIPPTSPACPARPVTPCRQPASPASQRATPTRCRAA